MQERSVYLCNGSKEIFTDTSGNQLCPGSEGEVTIAAE